MKKELFMNGVGILKIENDNFYIVDDDDEFYIKVNKETFIEELKRLSWVCLTTWNKELKEDYLDIVNYVKELK
jgi:hypothetical protein